MLSWAQAQRAASATGSDAARLAVALKAVPASERLTELERRSTNGSWEHELAREALAAPSEQRVSVVNLALGDVDHELTRGADWPRSGVRLALLVGALLAFAGFLAGASLPWALGTASVGGVGALACVEAGRHARQRVAKQREAVDALIGAVFGELPAKAPQHAEPARRRRRA